MSVTRLDHPARTRLEAGQVSLGVGLRNVRIVDAALMMKTAGMDWLFLDFEHTSLTLDTVAQLSMMANAVGISPIVRVPLGELDLASRALDCGAMGVVVPHVETAAEAELVVKRLRYAPIGERGVSGTLPHFGFKAVELRAATVELNRANLIAVMLETPQALSQADAIAAVPGIDIVMLGTNDLAMAYDKPGEFGSAEVAAAYETLAAACAKHGKWVGSGGLSSAEHFERYLKTGARFILAGADTGFMMAGARARTEQLRAISL